MPLMLTQEIRQIVTDLIAVKYRNGGKLTQDDLKDRAAKNLNRSLIQNLHHKTYTHESSDGILSVSLAYQQGAHNLTVAIGDLDPLQSDQSVHSETLYNIASISKFVLMVMCCRLVQAGQVSLDEPISRYISEDGLPDLDQITLRHLLAHRSGYKDRAFVSFGEKESLSTLIKHKGEDFDLAGKPGEQFYYANINFVLVAKVLMAIMQKDLKECLEALIVKPLQLKDLTVITDNQTDHHLLSKGYQADEKANSLRDCSDQFIFGATGFRATSSALARLISGFFINDFISPTLREEILNSIRDEMFEVVTPENTYRWPAKIGVDIEEIHVTLDNKEIVTVYGHGGWQNSHASFMVFDPKDNSAYACCFTKTFGLEKIYQSHLKQVLEKAYINKSGMNIPLMGLGCVDLRTENSGIIDLSLKRGVTFFDTAECYGNGASESALGEKLKSLPRNQLFISSKGGVKFNDQGIQLSGTPEAIKKACEASLERLKITYFDLYYLHRVDPQTPIETSVAALAELVKEGKIKHIGLSEVTETQLRRAHSIHPIAAVQIEYSPWSRHDDTNCLIHTCQTLGIAIVAYSPLGRGFFTEFDEKYFHHLPQEDYRKFLPRYNGDTLSHNIKAREHLHEVAKEKGCALSQLILAWIMRQGVCVIPGTTNAEHLNENLGALLVSLSEEEYKKINDLILSLEFSGERYPSPAFSGIFEEQTSAQQSTEKKPTASRWMPSREKALVGVGFVLIGGLFAYKLSKNPAEVAKTMNKGSSISL